MKRSLSILLLIMAVGCIWTAGGMHEALLAERSGWGLEVPEPLENAPPLLVFTTVVLGGFRGVLADMLWLRISHLQDQGRYFELTQLSDWVTKLEPRAGEIWAFHAWNLAYNVSVMMPDPESRWRWVRSGLELLRDRGLFYNPGDAALYYELAWLFQHKIGGKTDRYHAYYKTCWEQAMKDLLGSPHPDYAALVQDPDRMHTMRQTYRLEPVVMQEIEARYGQLDWFRPETHALYWAYLGLPFARGARLQACERLIRHSLAMLDAEQPSGAAPDTGNSF
jgi:hypothetical protein